MKYTRRLISAAIALNVIIIWGTVGYMYLEGYSFIEGLYMTVITIATIGFKEVRDLDDTGRVFTIFLAFAGTGLMLLYVGLLTQFIIEGQFRRIFGRRRVERAVARLKKHYILCGAGRIGSLIASEFQRLKVPFVVIELDNEKCAHMIENDVLVMNGSASDENLLTLARIMHSKGLLLSLGSDAETVYAILTAKQLNPDIFIIARANDVGSAKKLAIAGANMVVSPYQSVSSKMVNAMLRPEVADMFETPFLEENLDLAMEGIKVPKDCVFAGKTLLESNFRADYGLTVVGIKKATGKLVLGPGPKDIILEGDVLIVAGRREDVTELLKNMETKS